MRVMMNRRCTDLNACISCGSNDRLLTIYENKNEATKYKVHICKEYIREAQSLMSEDENA